MNDRHGYLNLASYRRPTARILSFLHGCLLPDLFRAVDDASSKLAAISLKGLRLMAALPSVQQLTNVSLNTSSGFIIDANLGSQNLIDHRAVLTVTGLRLKVDSALVRTVSDELLKTGDFRNIMRT